MIPQLLELKPRLLYWRPGEVRVPKTVQVRVTHEEPLRVFLPPPSKVSTAEVAEPADTQAPPVRPASSNGQDEVTTQPLAQVTGNGERSAVMSDDAGRFAYSGSTLAVAVPLETLGLRPGDVLQ